MKLQHKTYIKVVLLALKILKMKYFCWNCNIKKFRHFFRVVFFNKNKNIVIINILETRAKPGPALQTALYLIQWVSE